MSNDTVKRREREDQELEREIRSKRKFSLAEAIGREGADLMKGASPVTRKRQAEIQIQQYLKEHLHDSEGALRRVLVRQVRESEALLESHYDDPLLSLVKLSERILVSEERLSRFVRAIDAEWGRIYSERPYFESDDGPPDRRDPYTRASVREALAELIEDLVGDD